MPASPEVPTEEPIAFACNRRGRCGVAVVRVRGDVDLATAATFQSELEEALDDGAELLLVDMREVTFLDGRGIHALLAARQHATDRDSGGDHVHLLRPSALVRRVLDVTRLTGTFPVHDTVTSALGAVHRHRSLAGAASR